MVQLPDTLLDAVRERLRSGLAEIADGDAAITEEITGRVVSYLRNTAETTVSVEDDGTTFVITGDIPAMWLRDSAAQLTPLLRLVSAEVGPEQAAQQRDQLGAALPRDRPLRQRLQPHPGLLALGRGRDRARQPVGVGAQVRAGLAVLRPGSGVAAVVGERRHLLGRRAVRAGRTRDPGHGRHRAASRGALPVRLPPLRGARAGHPGP